MLNARKIRGVTLATAAAVVFAAAPVLAGENAETAKVHCVGVNACKGKSDCQTASSACKGHNACKGHGFVAMPKRTCEQIGGKVE
jgi:hypothetical protein